MAEFGTSDYQAKYFAYALTREGGKGVERLQQSLLNASVDLNPHQVEATLFALRSPLSKGVMLADEVGLGKTIEAGLVLCQLWAERKRKLLVICPAALRKQWQCELEDKFNLPCQIVDARAVRLLQKEGFANPYEKPVILISSYPFAAKMSEDLKKVQWNLVVMDEAHKLRNSYRESNRVGQALRWALENRRKLLLTATPLQNSLTELYGIATLLDDTAFGDLPSFRSRYVNAGGDLDGLRQRLKDFCWRTLRKDVLAFVKYTNRLPLTEAFASSDRENALYEDVSRYLQDETTYAFPENQRSMLTLVVRKVLASSTWALIGTLEHIGERLKRLQEDTAQDEEDLLVQIFADEPDLISELEEDAEDEDPDVEDDAPRAARVIDPQALRAEIRLVEEFIARARGLGDDTKARHLLTALDKGWNRLRELGAAEKAVVFTESRRSMNFLREFLEANGYAGEVVCFSGGGKKDATAEAIYAAYKEAHPEDDVSRPVMMRHALIDAFRNKAKILIATEAGAEGINLQFCSMVVNYDLPWNPQRVEQRIGRCHRYGQKYDVVVVNFCNTRNAADVRVYELLRSKLRLFEGVFGASNDVLGVIDENGRSFERQINEILQQCRSKEEIETAFDELQKNFEAQIAAAKEKTCQDIIENLDDEVRAKLKIDPAFAKDYLSDGEYRFMVVTRQVLGTRANFNSEDPRVFVLVDSPRSDIPAGAYGLKGEDSDSGVMTYRPNSALGEWVIEEAKRLATPPAEVTFDLAAYHGKLSAVEALRGREGWLRLDRVTLKSLDREDFLLFSALTAEGEFLDPEIVGSMFKLGQSTAAVDTLDARTAERLEANARQYAKATASQVAEENNVHFKEATDKILRWSEDQIAAATHRIETLRARQFEVERQIRHARTLDEQMPLQKELDQIRREVRRARANVTTIEDETDQKRSRLLDALQRKLVPEVEREELFTLKWRVI